MHVKTSMETRQWALGPVTNSSSRWVTEGTQWTRYVKWILLPRVLEDPFHIPHWSASQLQDWNLWGQGPEKCYVVVPKWQVRSENLIVRLTHKLHSGKIISLSTPGTKFWPWPRKIIVIICIIVNTTKLIPLIFKGVRSKVKASKQDILVQSNFHNLYCNWSKYRLKLA